MNWLNQLRSVERWTPASLGALAWWTADMRFIGMLGDGPPSGISRWRNRIDGRSGVLVQIDDERDPEIAANWRGVGVALKFEEQDVTSLHDSTNETGSYSTVISGVGGTDTPFSVLMTIQVQTATPADDFAAGLVNWYADSNSTTSTFHITSNGLLQYIRTDSGGTSNDAEGNIEIGTAIRRIACVFEGTVIKTYVDTVLDLNTGCNVGALTTEGFRVGNIVGGIDGPSLYIFDIAIIPRAIDYNEWLHYYDWSVKRWGAIKSPAHVASGAGASGIGVGTITPAYPSGLSAGDYFLMHITQFTEVAPPTSTGWTEVAVQTNGSLKHYVFEKDTRATGSESGTVDVAVSSTASAVQIHAFRGVCNSPTTAGYMESGPFTKTGTTTCAVTDMGPNGYGRLAVAFYTTTTTTAVMAANVGSAGGTWVEGAEYNNLGVSSLNQQLQVAPLMPIPITGGSSTMNDSGGASACLSWLLIGT